MRIKILVLSLVGVTLSILGSQMTLAYFTDSEESMGTFSIGQISVLPVVASIARAGEGNVVHTDGEILQSAASYNTYVSEHCSEMLSGAGAESVCNKYLFVKNNGENPVYVRVRVEAPVELVTIAAEPAASEPEPGASEPEPSASEPEPGGGSEPGASEPEPGSGTTEDEEPPITLNFGNFAEEYSYETPYTAACSTGTGECMVYVVTRISALLAGEMTSAPVMESITVNAVATVGGEGGGASEDYASLTEGVKMYTEAIQAQGFANAAEAFSHY